jgi:hypothetical protein
MPHLNVVWLTAMGHRMTEVYGLAYAGPGSPVKVKIFIFEVTFCIEKTIFT